MAQKQHYESLPTDEPVKPDPSTNKKWGVNCPIGHILTGCLPYDGKWFCNSCENEYKDKSLHCYVCKWDLCYKCASKPPPMCNIPDNKHLKLWKEGDMGLCLACGNFIKLG
jgi:hypothetical protein